MAIYFGKWQKRVGVGRETSYGNLATIARYISCDAEIEFKKDSVFKETLGVNRAVQQNYKREEVVTAKISGAVEPDNIGELLCAVFGTFSSGTNLEASAGTQFIHTFEPVGTISDSFSSITCKVDLGNGTVYDYVGVRGNSITISSAGKEDVKYEFNGIGQREIAGTSCPVTIKYGTWRPFEFSDVLIEIDGTARNDIHNFELSISNNLSDGFRVGTQTYTIKPLPAGFLDVSLKMTMEYNDVDRQRYLGGTNIGIKITLTGDTIAGTAKNQMIIRLPYTNFKVAPFGYEEELLSLAVEAQAMEGGTSFAGTSYPIRIELLNMVNSY